MFRVLVQQPGETGRGSLLERFRFLIPGNINSESQRDLGADVVPAGQQHHPLAPVELRFVPALARSLSGRNRVRIHGQATLDLPDPGELLRKQAEEEWGHIHVARDVKGADALADLREPSGDVALLRSCPAALLWLPVRR